ncbi:MAG: geranylgeranylglycerol-phosphate geranylgeranyltransferase [Candidatus Latescibacteria bacterium]|nr:geranylgeranylglycerol-phosphate geranylgeranyltransferase [Candidatus Latescibacterota bacterium]
MCSKPAIPEHAAAPACPRLRAAAEILRPVNCALTFASVLLGGWLGSHTLSPTLLIAGLSASLIMAGGNVLNDLRDREADRINKPLRPLPSGRLPARIGRLLAVLCTALGLALAFLLPRPATLVAAFAVTALVAYNVHLKGIPLLGNLLVSLLCGLSFLYGGAAVGNAPQALIPAAFALLYHLGREILKDVEDREGDRLLRGSTLPLSWGRNRALGLVTATYLVLAILTPLPYRYGIYGMAYLAGVLLLDILLACVLVALWRGRSPHRYRRLGELLKAGMVLGLFAILLGGF